MLGNDKVAQTSSRSTRSIKIRIETVLNYVLLAHSLIVEVLDPLK